MHKVEITATAEVARPVRASQIANLQARMRGALAQSLKTEGVVAGNPSVIVQSVEVVWQEPSPEPFIRAPVKLATEPEPEPDPEPEPEPKKKASKKAAKKKASKSAD